MQQRPPDLTGWPVSFIHLSRGAFSYGNHHSYSKLSSASYHRTGSHLPEKQHSRGGLSCSAYLPCLVWAEKALLRRSQTAFNQAPVIINPGKAWQKPRGDQPCRRRSPVALQRKDSMEGDSVPFLFLARH